MITTKHDSPRDVASPPSTSPLVNDLLRSEAYPGSLADPVELRQTHASWVFLVGEEVFKVKRPVDLGFLDYRTLEARRRACEDEVRLNRRLAPDVYLGVEPVRRDLTGHHLGGKGEIVDWTVHMRRLPDAASAQALLAAGRLDRVQLEALANRMARFLDGAPRAACHGALAALRRNIEQNMSQSLATTSHDEIVERDTIDEICRYQNQELRFRADRFAARIGGGHIRDGHGDLRLEHVYFLPRAGGAAPVVIDCVEFSAAFRAGDVASELAFLAMELEAAGRSDLAAGFVARSAEALDDFELYGVLDFYLCYRASVRAKIATLLATDPQASHELRAEKRAEAQRDFALARACAGRPLEAPGLLAVGGVIGSGKSTLAAMLGRALSAPVIGSDRTRKALAGLAPNARGGGEHYTPAQTEATYAALMRRAEVVLDSGRTVILDATFEDVRWREVAEGVARAFGATYAFIEASCPDWNTLRQRVRDRAARGSESDADEALLDRYVEAGRSPCLVGEGRHIVIDTRASATSMVGRAVEELTWRGISAPPGREYLVAAGSA